MVGEIVLSPAGEQLRRMQCGEGQQPAARELGELLLLEKCWTLKKCKVEYESSLLVAVFSVPNRTWVSPPDNIGGHGTNNVS